jgi:hypothetical protein
MQSFRSDRITFARGRLRRSDHAETGHFLRARPREGQKRECQPIERAGGELDGTRQFWWLEARNLRAFASELRRITDPLFHL